MGLLAFNDELKAQVRIACIRANALAYIIQLLSVNGTSYQVAIFLTKLSILLLYLRLFSVNKLFAFFVITSIVIVTIFYIPLIGVGIGFLVTCNDVMNLDSPLCIQSWSMLLLNASLNVITDLWLLLLPFPLVMKLRLQPRKKLGLVTVFAAGVGQVTIDSRKQVDVFLLIRFPAGPVLLV